MGCVTQMRINDQSHESHGVVPFRASAAVAVLVRAMMRMRWNRSTP